MSTNDYVRFVDNSLCRIWMLQKEDRKQKKEQRRAEKGHL